MTVSALKKAQCQMSMILPLMNFILKSIKLTASTNHLLNDE